MKEPDTQNITLVLPRQVLRKVKILAVERQTSISGLLTDLLKEVVEREDAYAVARERALASLKERTSLGTKGRITWSRDDVHER